MANRVIGPPPRTHSFALGGGLDLVTPAIAMPPGRVIAASNYEPTIAGYHFNDGFERFDGQPKPSEASYWVLHFDAGLATIAAGATVTGGTSSATGVTLYAATVETGSYAGSDAAGYLVLTNVVGTFQDNEALKVSGSTKSTANGLALESGATDDTNNTTWLRAAIEAARTAIQKVPGALAMRGVWKYKTTVYAFRDDAATPTECCLYKSTTAGWVKVTLGRSVAFTSGGTVEITAGVTITGATSSATAVVGRVLKTSGTWAGGDAAGRLILTSQTGTLQSENLNIGASLNVATIGANSTAISLAPSGRFECITHNFYGASNLSCMYGCDGKNKAFEFDGTVYTPIVTGMTTDTPNHLAAHKEHLFLMFPGGSLQFSTPGEPQTWSVVVGAGEIGLGQEGTGLVPEIADTMFVAGSTKLNVLYGNDKSDFVFKPLTKDSGAIAWTIQDINGPVYLDGGGVRNWSTAQAYGDFKVGTLSLLVDPWIEQKRKAGINVTASVRIRAKDQYRIFFDDGTGLSFYLGKKSPEVLPFDLGIVVRCICAVTDETGNEEIYFGSDDGYIYQLDAGTSFDGEEIEAYLRLPFCDNGSHAQNKAYKKVTVELDAPPTCQISLSSEFSYANPNSTAVSSQAFDISGGGGFWGEANWAEFYWSSAVKSTATAWIGGLGNNISTTIASKSTYDQPHTLHGVIYTYTFRGPAK